MKIENPKSREGLAQLTKCLMSPTKDVYIPIDRVQCARTGIEMYTKYQQDIRELSCQLFTKRIREEFICSFKRLFTTTH